MGSPNKEPQEYTRNIEECKDTGRYIPVIFLLYSWGSLSGVQNKIPLNTTCWVPSASIFQIHLNPELERSGYQREPVL